MAALRPAHTPSSQIKKIEKNLAEAEAIKKMIIEANLRLVVGIAGKHAAASGANLLDLISEGNLSLLRAVEKFDYTRGFRFATYAAWAITKGLCPSSRSAARANSINSRTWKIFSGI